MLLCPQLVVKSKYIDTLIKLFTFYFYFCFLLAESQRVRGNFLKTCPATRALVRARAGGLVMKSFYPKSFLTYIVIFIDTLNGSSWPKTCRAAQADGGNLLENVL